MDRLKKKYKSLSKQVKATIWFLLCGLLQRGITVIVTPIFTRLMSTEEYGQYTLFSSWLEVIGIFLTLRLYYGVFMQGLIRYDNDKDEYTSALQGLTTLIEIIALIIYLPFREIVNDFTGLDTILTICIFLSSWASAMFGFWSTRQRVEYRYRALVILTLIVAIIQPVSGIVAVLLYQTQKVDARVISMAIVQVTFFGWIFIYYFGKSKKLYSKEFWIHALKFNIPLIPHYLSHILLNQSDRIMIARIISKSAAGIYGLAYNLSWIMTIFNQALLKTLDPWIYQSIRDKDYKRLAKVSYFALVGVSILNISLIAIAPEVISIFAPQEYHEGIWLVPPLAITVVIMFMYSLFADFEFYYEKTSFVMLASVLGAIINIALNFYLLPLYGFQVAAYTTLIGYIVYIGMHYCFMRYVQIKEMNGIRVYDPKILLGIVAVDSIAAAILASLYSLPIIRYVICVTIIIIIYLKRDIIKDVYSIIR